MEEADDLSEFLDLLEEDCAADEANSSQQTTPPATNGLREISDPDDFLRPRDDAGPSNIHAGDTDSSDDEDNRNHQEQNFTSYGRDVKKMITVREKESVDNKFSLSSLKGTTQRSVQSDPKVSWSRSQAVALTAPSALKTAERVSGLTGKLMDVADRDCFLEPVSGIRVVNPLVSQSFIQERTAGRQTVACSMVKRKYESNALEEDWLTTGVVVGVMKKVSQKSKEYLSWTISDLKHDMLTVTVFLFSAANSAFTKVAKGTVVGILNPNVLPPSSAKFDLILSINDAQRVLIIGNSKDYGVCKSKTIKNEPCSNFVNVNICPYCTYHLSKEYKKHSGKPTAPNSNLMNKVLGKSEVFYGGRSFSAKMNPPKKISREHLAQLALPQADNKKIQARDHQRMQTLIGSHEPCTKPTVISVDPRTLRPKTITRSHLIMSNSRRVTSLVPSVDQKPAAATSKLAGVLGKKGSGNTSSPLLQPKVPAVVSTKPDISKFGVKSSNPSCSTSKQLESNQKPKVNLPTLSKPTLGKFGSIDLGNLGKKSGGSLDLGNLGGRKARGGNNKQNAKLAALQLVRQKGPLKKENPNLIKKKATQSKVVASLKRKIIRSIDDEDDEAKQRSEFEKKKAKFLELIETGSQHQDLIASAQQEAEDDYFKNMETKEKIEDKMLNTHKVEAKAVQCTQCNYTALARSEFCRKQGHQVKIVQAHKRFFQCKGCKNHIWVLGIVPTTACSNCSQNNWEKAGMIKDKSAKLETLRISAGDRETFTQANINCLVPD